MKESLTGVPQEFNADHKHIFGDYLEYRMIRLALRDVTNLTLVPLNSRKYYRAIESQRQSDFEPEGKKK
jgi:hypothetical protein